MRASFPNSRARRRGQALLLAVLIMIFAALVSAAFIGVVATNINQSALQTDKDRAVVATKAGLDYVNQQLTYSAEGDKWRTELANVPPAPSDPSYAVYYSPLDIAQGWARTTAHPTTDLNGNGKVYDGTDLNTIDPGDEAIALAATRTTGKTELVKSPDPRANQSDPVFLSQVERIPRVLSATNPEYPHAGALKITVIGLSSDDPSAWNRKVSYKGGIQEAPIGQTMRVVSNWNFTDSVVPAGKVFSYNPTGSGGPTIRIEKANTDFGLIAKPLVAGLPPTSAPAIPFSIIYSDLSASTQGAVVRDVTTIPATPTTPIYYDLTLAATPSPAPIVGDRVEAAANIGAPTGVDYTNVLPATATNLTSVNYELSDGAITGGTRVNGGLWWQGIVKADLLRSQQNASATQPAGRIQVSGTMAINGVTSTLIPSPTPAAVSVQEDGSSTPTTLVASSNASVYDADLVDDGWKRLKGSSPTTTDNSTRSVNDFLPPDISSGQGLERYRDMTRFSKPLGFAVAGATVGGYGEGIYIDNIQDKEKVYDGSLREMTQSELIKMWLSPQLATPTMQTDYTRTGVPIAVTDANVSLEQKHLRGWVGSDEFRARGVSIELNGTVTPPTIIVTRDARDDGALTNVNQDPDSSNLRTWKDPQNNTAVKGAYQQELPWPINGVIFAEGNVRIRGTVTNAPRSLTVVSMNNIYIEGSLSAAPSKVLLLAKKNVVMNPTRLMGRPDDISTVTGVASVTKGTATTLAVSDAAPFKKGDFIQTMTSAGVVSSQGYVAADPARPVNGVFPTSLSFIPTTSSTIAANDVVRTPLSTPNAVAGANRNVVFNTITTTTDSTQRRLYLPTTLPANIDIKNLRLAFNHQADKVPMFSVGIEIKPGGVPAYTLPTNPVYFANKGIPLAGPPAMAPFLDSNAAVVPQANKKFHIDYSEPIPSGTGSEDFPNPAPSTDTAAQAIDLTTISGTMNAKSYTDPSMPGGVVGWQYKTSVVNPAAYGTLPFYTLAGVGNRYDFGATTASLDARRDIRTTPYVVPLATSIGLFLNGGPATVFSEHWNTGLPTANYDQARYFGFSPTFTDPSTSPVIPSEDVLTGDQGFYQTDVLRSTLDSRSLYNINTNVSALLTATDNSLSLQPSDVPQPVSATYPTYRLFDTKLENVSLAQAAGVVTVTGIDTAYTFDVNAYVYAQTGSWFVIPSPLFDERLRGIDANGATQVQTYLDLDNSGAPNTGEYTKGAANTVNLTTWEPGDYVDLNRNGTLDDFEKHAMARYSRFNYQINFTGAIAENQTPLINDIGTGTNAVQGAVGEWMSKWGTTTYNGTTATHGRMNYVFDPSVAVGALDNDAGFNLPQNPRLSYES